MPSWRDAQPTGMPRLIMLDNKDTPTGELDPRGVIALDVVEEVNGEHSLTIETTEELAKNTRVLWRDGMGIWHEWVVQGLTATHDHPVVSHEYYCVWSIQHDLSETFIDTDVGLVPGHASTPSAARLGVEATLSGTSRWSIGTIDVTAQASGSFYRRSGWEGAQQLVEKWGGEIEPTIEVASDWTVTRSFNFLQHVGATTPTRRFDYSGDVAGIKRTVSDDPWTCRIIPLGKGSETENGGYTRRPTIESVNSGKMYLEDSSVVSALRIPDGSGGWEYPVQIVLNDSIEEPADLLTWAQDNIEDYTRPKVTYEVDVVQYAEAGTDPLGVALGDEVVVVDTELMDGGLRIEARVRKMKYSLLDRGHPTLTVGNARQTFGLAMNGLSGRVKALTEQIASTSVYQATAAYMENMLSRINAEINATGGYTYITEGYGIRTYDTPVSDPTTGLTANSVVEIKGGTIRIANSKTSSGDWDWKTVFTAGHVAADLITAINVVTGMLTSADGYSYWDLDNGLFQMLSQNTQMTIGRADSSGNLKSGVVLDSGFAYATNLGDLIVMTPGSVARGQPYGSSEYVSYQNGIFRVQNSYGSNGLNLTLDGTLRSPTATIESDAPLYIRGGSSPGSSTTQIQLGVNGASNQYISLYGDHIRLIGTVYLTGTIKNSSGSTTLLSG